MSLDGAIQAIQNIYAFMDKMDVTPGFLIGLALLLSLAGLFAVREAAAWFFKVEDLRTDIDRLHDIAVKLEGEIRVVQKLVSQNQANENRPGQIQQQAEVTNPDWIKISPEPHPEAPASEFAGAQELRQSSSAPAQDDEQIGPILMKDKPSSSPSSSAFPFSH